MDIENKRNLQMAEFEILCEFDRVCRKNKLTYFLCGGTLLGAVRHRGFIPWDDDIDVCMPIEDYRIFCKIANRELGESFFFQNFQTDMCYWFFGKVRKNNTACIEKGWENKHIHQGVWVDVFPLVGAYSNDRKNERLNRIQDMMKRILKIKYDGCQGKNLRGKRIILKYIPVGIVRLFVSLVSRLIHMSIKKKEECCYLWGRCKIERLFPTRYISTITQIEFEGKQFYAPERWHELLSITYGDYMTPPPPDQRNGGEHTISFVDLDRDYKYYLDFIGDNR